MGKNYFGITDPGRERTNNEDSFITQTVSSGNLVIACVIDGVGGYEGGEIAAQLTKDEIIRELRRLPGNIIEHMVTALNNANERIIKEKQVSPQNEKMACVVTLAAVDIKNNVFYFAHVGDTRLYLSRDGSLIKITRDHSSVGFLEESGRLTEEAAIAHPKRNEVNKVLGYERQISLVKDFIDTGESPFLPGDTILLCSDGLTDMITTGNIITVLSKEKDLAAKGRQLIKAANDAGGKDNITVVLVHNDKSRVQHAVTKPPVLHEGTKPPVRPEKIRKEGNKESMIIEKVADADKQLPRGAGTRNNKFLRVFFYIIFIFIIIWSLARIYKNTRTKKVLPATPVAQRNREELDFIDSINTSATGIVNLAGGNPIIVTDTIKITNDSAHIIGKGKSFIRDSAYAGPLFMMASSCKYLLLDSLIIENFTVGVLVINKGLHLNNVRFKNCLVPVLFQQHFANDTLLTGRQSENIFYLTDSLHK
ncbi:MAG: protein phosphatase 2C domain-containing protein [Ferruginibacter sp.]